MPPRMNMPAGPGRPKGSVNKLTKSVREAIEGAFQAVGGAEYLADVAKRDPKTFCALLGKVLPMQVTGEGGTALAIQVITGIPQAPGTDGDDS